MNETTVATDRHQNSGASIGARSLSIEGRFVASGDRGEVRIEGVGDRLVVHATSPLPLLDLTRMSRPGPARHAFKSALHFCKRSGVGVDVLLRGRLIARSDVSRRPGFLARTLGADPFRVRPFALGRATLAWLYARYGRDA